jgi:serine phosphatase RsbU (regulator of sigma subunit)
MIASPDIHRAQILIVDDQVANVRLLERLLTGAGYLSLATTMDPHEVCALHRKNRYDLILLDLQMPGMDGFQVMENLKEIETDGYLPVVVITAQPGHKLRALEAGAKDFVSKPIDLAEVLMRVRNMLEVRLLHKQATTYGRQLEQSLRELEDSREIIRLKTLEERRKSEAELTLAQETQRSLLPRLLPQFENFRIHAFNNPTRYVGGDFYDFLQLSSGEWMGVLADVAGKGMAAALLSSMVLGALQTDFRAGTHVLDVIKKMNLLLCEKSLDYQFVTLFVFLLSPAGGGQFISAGHNTTYVFRAASGKTEKLISDDFFLGMFDDAAYTSRPLRLDKGDILVVYSDGLTDAENFKGEMFGERRLRMIIEQWAFSGSNVVERKLLEAVEAFTQGMPQLDDITFVMVEKYQ